MSQPALHPAAYAMEIDATAAPPAADRVPRVWRSRPKLPRWIARTLTYLKREVESYEVETWKASLRRCGTEVQISERCSIWGYEGLSIGDRSAIHQFTHIFATGGVNIGSDVMISANCTISSVTHLVVTSARNRKPLVLRPVNIADNVWIGMGARILPGVSIGRDSVVGAGAVVTRDVPERSVVVGNPAHILRSF
jgi:maltose O-acetyltransferase